jgi:hypothetical protein
MNSQHHKGNSRYTSSILKLDIDYIDGMCVSRFGTNTSIKSDRILQTYYPKFEFSCPICGAGNQKLGRRPACLFPTNNGYLFKCNACMKDQGAISFYNLLLKLYPDVAQNYQKDRWINKLTGKGFNCPKPEDPIRKEPDKNKRKEHYQRLAREQYEQNKSEYERRHKEQGA